MNNFMVRRRGSTHMKLLTTELHNCINDEERKNCYLKFILDQDFNFSDSNMVDFNNLVTKNYYYIQEEENENLGNKLINQNNQLNKMLPTYILFYNKPNVTKQYRKINNIISRNDLASRNSFKYFQDYDEFTNFIDNDVLVTDFQKNNFNVTLFGKEIIHKSIYKKMRVKYDFYYVLLNDFEATTAKIDFLKNKQLLELLGAEKIVIDRTFIKNKIISNMIGTGNENIEHHQEKEKIDENKDIYKYKLTRGFFSSVDDFLKKVDEDKYILLSRREIISDFELKSLLGSRIEKGLNEFNKIIKITNVSKKELKLNLIFQNNIGISFGNKSSNTEENYFKIYAKFYGIETLYCLDEIPLTYEGFKILNQIKNEDERAKYIDNFYVRYLKKRNCLSKHIQRLENNTLPAPKEGESDSSDECLSQKADTKNDFYKRLLRNINSFMNVEHLVDSLQNINQVTLNQDGFDTMRLATIENFHNYNSYKKSFVKRFTELNDIDYKKFKDYIETVHKKDMKKYIEEDLKSFETLKDLLNSYLCDPLYSTLDERGHYFIFRDITDLTTEEKEERFRLYFNRYIKHIHKKTITDTDQLDFINENKINILCKLDFFMFNKLADYIVEQDTFILEERRTGTCMHGGFRMATTPQEVRTHSPGEREDDDPEYNQMYFCINDNSMFDTLPRNKKLVI